MTPGTSRSSAPKSAWQRPGHSTSGSTVVVVATLIPTVGDDLTE
jgi:hypothetical protein